MNYQENLHAIRAKMLEKNIDAYIIPSSDPHMSEYVPDHYKCIQFLSGFTGSAGTLVITATFAGLWTDFRYFQQAAQQLQGSGFELVKLKVQHTPEYIEWIYKSLSNGGIVAFDFQLLSVSVAEQIKNSLTGKQIAIKDIDLIDDIWQERPLLPNNEAFLLPDKDCGQAVNSKLHALRSEMVKNQSNAHILSSLDDLAWLFNIRGNDVSYNPVVLCYAIITLENVTVYINSSQFSSTDLKGILDQTIEIKDCHQITTDIAKLQNCAVLLDEKRTCYQFLTLLSSTVTVIKKTNPVVHLKSIKNKVEIENIKNAMLQD
ncbi:MAG: aminopeptidase P family protein, partial [Sphingobacteriales bacterium]